MQKRGLKHKREGWHWKGMLREWLKGKEEKGMMAFVMNLIKTTKHRWMEVKHRSKMEERQVIEVGKETINGDESGLIVLN